MTVRVKRSLPSRARIATTFACAALAWLAASCAPPPPGSLESIESAARAGAHRRERRLEALEARAVLRLDGRATGRLPAVAVTTRLASPDRVRLQARWALGTLLDAVVAGDTLTAWMPGQRLGLRVPALGDSLGIRDPGRFFGRAIVASWQPPAEAWRVARMDSAGATLDWKEGGAVWTLHVDAFGRPGELRVARDTQEVRVRYSGWHGSGRAAMPSRVELQDGGGWVRVRMDLEDVHSLRRPKPAWFRLSLPDDVAPLDLEDLRRVLTFRGRLR